MMLDEINAIAQRQREKEESFRHRIVVCIAAG